ncbi:MAG: Hsp70 family protein, partial [Polyangiales bacterium]
DVILVGGTTKIPYVRDQVSKFFGRAPRTDVNPEDAVAVGAALQARALAQILSRKSSRRIPIVTAPDDEAFSGETNTVDNTVDNLLAGSDVEMDDEETQTVQQAALKPDTSYSLPRTGTREVFEGKTPPPPAAIGRLKPMPRTTDKGVPTAAPQSKTMVAEAPPRAPTPPPVPSKPPTQRGMPAAPQPDNWGSTDDFQTNPAAEQPTVVVEPELTPTASPQATTLMSSSPPPPAQEPSPASTAKGFAPPQQYPVTQTPPPRPPAHQMPTQMAMQPPPAHQMPTQMAMQPPPMQQMPAAPPQAAFQMPPMPAPPPPAPVHRPPVVLDVTPRSLGIATVSGYCEELIRRNSRLPTEMVKMFTTSRDKQDAVRIVVCQGESRRLDNNTVIGDLRLEGIPARPRGETSIEVTFQLDASGILQVSAKDALTGREQTARLDLVGGVRGEHVAASRERVQQLRR